MPSKDFIPNSWTAFASWCENFAAQLPTVAEKYKISAETLAAVNKDTAWIQYWVDAKLAAKQQEKQLTDFVEEVTNGEFGGEPADKPVWSLPPNAPPDVATGIKKRIREIAAQIKAQKSIYTEADGALLGIVAPDDVRLSPEDLTPDLKLHTLANFALEADFRKQGLDALRVEARRKNADWQMAAFLTSSPGVFNVVPLTPNAAEQIEIRAVFIKDNQPFGNYSPIYTALIAP